MAAITTNQIRNVALLGHGGSGKTSLAEAMLYITKASDRLGKPSEGNTVCDYDAEEIKRGFTLQTALAPIDWKNNKINMIDVPGYFDFVGEVLQSVRVADSALITVDCKAGVEVGTELSWDYASEAGLPRAFFVNKCDDPDAHFDKVLAQLQETFGPAVCPVIVPMGQGASVKGFINLIDQKAYTYDAAGKRTEGAVPAEFADEVEEYRNALMEAIAGTSDELMEKFFGGEEISTEEALEAIHTGIVDGSVVPVICGAAAKLWAVDAVLDIIADSFPRHTAKGSEKDVEGGKVAIEEAGEPALFVFKTIADPFGKMTFFKVMSGTLKKDMTIKNITSGTSEKFGHFYVMRGKKQIEVDELCCGDIGMVQKLVATNTNDTLTNNGAAKEYSKVEFPQPFLSKAIKPKSKGDEDKIATGVNRLREEDLTIKYENNPETKQLVISGMGDTHLDVITSKLKARYNVDVDLSDPKIPYRETIKKKIQVEGKHKKQSGGHGQYGHVRITFAPGEDEGLTFTESVVGGTVPKNFYPAVEKGLHEAMEHGVLAGYPMVHLAADLYDGSYHEVDSSEMAFKIAANLAYKELVNASPVLLEPVGSLKTYVPGDMVGDVYSDLGKRRGIVLGSSAWEKKKGYQIVEAEVPLAEMSDYTIALRALSKGKGTFTFEVIRYSEVPGDSAQKIIAVAKAEAEAEK